MSRATAVEGLEDARSNRNAERLNDAQGHGGALLGDVQGLTVRGAPRVPRATPAQSYTGMPRTTTA